jgi:hypothetical protein
LLGFTWIYLVESGLFNGLRAKKLKKFPACPTRAAGCVRNVPAVVHSPFLLAAGRLAKGVSSDHWEIVVVSSEFVKSPSPWSRRVGAFVGGNWKAAAARGATYSRRALCPPMCCEGRRPEYEAGPSARYFGGATL